jgi:hypothetical protein
MSHPAPTIQNHLGLVTLPISHTAIGHMAEVTFAFDCSGLASAQIAVDNFQGTLAPDLTLLLDSDCVFGPAMIKLGDGTNVPHEAIAAGSGTPGSVGGNMLPPNCALLVKKGTGFGGKKNRGRSYWPYMLQEAHVDETGTIDAPTVGSFQAQFDLWQLALIAVTLPMVIANRTEVVTPPDTRPHVTAITMGNQVLSYKVQALIATQRRRLGR